MHIRFLPFGMGDPHRAIQYLLADKDHNGYLRPVVSVLRGNPQMVAEVAASLSTVHRYTSVVIAWAPCDMPTQEEILAVVEDFERLAFAGKEAQQISHCVVSHGDHVHILIARVDLQTGKAMNIAPPIWRKHFDHLRNHWNHKMGWARPDDPARARLVQSRGELIKRTRSDLHRAEAESAEFGFAVSDILAASGEEPTLKQIIGDRLEWMVQTGQIKKRTDVVAELKNHGEINREGVDYVSIKPSDGGKPMRFKGLLFRQDFNAESYLKGLSAPTPFARTKPNPAIAEEEREAIVAAIQRRKSYYEKINLTTSTVNRAEREPEDSVLTELAAADLQPKELEPPHVRNRHPLDQSLQEVFDAARSAVQIFISICRRGFQNLECSKRAIAAAQRACGAAQQASERVGRATRKVTPASGHQADVSPTRQSR